MARLTAVSVRALVKPGRYGDGGNLYLQVQDGGLKSWLFRYQLAGRSRQMGLGAIADVSLAQAREKAREARALVKAGKDPIEQRKATRAAQGAANGTTFRRVAELYLGAHQASWRNEKHRQQWRNTLEQFVFPRFGDRPVTEIATGDVMRVLEPIWHAKPETASRVRGRIESVLDYATARGWRIGENPARWRGHLANLLPARSKIARVNHHAALPWREIGPFMMELRQQEGIGALALQFAILTATRTGEVIGARWSEIDAEAATWLIPAERMKAGRAHRVPLSEPAMALLRQFQPLQSESGDGYVFPGAKPGSSLSNMALLMALRRMGRDDLTTHGFRSTFRDWAAEATAYPNHVVEQALAHTIGDKVEAAYRRGDLFEKRRALMDEWATFVRV